METQGTTRVETEYQYLKKMLRGWLKAWILLPQNLFMDH